MIARMCAFVHECVCACAHARARVRVCSVGRCVCVCWWWWCVCVCVCVCMPTEKSLGERVCSYGLCNEFLSFFNLTRMVRIIFDIR